MWTLQGITIERCAVGGSMEGCGQGYHGWEQGGLEDGVAGRSFTGRRPTSEDLDGSASIALPLGSPESSKLWFVTA